MDQTPSWGGGRRDRKPERKLGYGVKSKSGAFLVIVFEDHTQNRELCQPPVIGWKSSRGG